MRGYNETTILFFEWIAIEVVEKYLSRREDACDAFWDRHFDRIVIRR